MLKIEQLIEYLRNEHKIEISNKDIINLRNIGYYHGYKGYRFIKNSKNKINFNNFSEIVALNKFDNDLKAILYPKVMFIENSLKSYVLESVLNESNSEYLDDIFSSCLTDYKKYVKGSESYKKKIKERIELKNKINNALLRDYSKGKKTINHFLDNDKPVPIWAIFESLTLGEFGNFFDCSNLKVKLSVSKILNLPTNLDSNGELVKSMIYTLKDLRNSIAHNNIIFDTRFKSRNISKKLMLCLEQETKIKDISFNSIGDYFILIVYILVKMQVSKKECNEFINSYIKCIEILKMKISNGICNQITTTKHRNNIIQLKDFIDNSN